MNPARRGQIDIPGSTGVETYPEVRLWDDIGASSPQSLAATTVTLLEEGLEESTE